MTLWTCWSIPVISIDPVDDPKISSKNLEPPLIKHKTSSSHSNWFQKYILLQRIRHGALAWSGCSLFSFLLIWFEPGSYSFGILLSLSFFFLILSSVWSFFRVNKEDSLKKLGGTYSDLVEKLRTQFDLDRDTEIFFID